MVATSTTNQQHPHRDPSQLRAEIARARAEIAESFEALGREAVARTDWREWVRRRPALVLGCAFALGLSLGSRD